MHPYRWPTIGWRSDLEAMTRQDLWRHYRRWYVPGNAVLVIAGDVDVARAVAAARRHFGPIPAALVDSELAVSAGSALLPTEQPYLYEISVTLREGVEHRRAERAVAEVLDRACAERPREGELQKARNQVLSALAFESERVSEIAHQIGTYATIASLASLDALPQAVAGVTAEQVRAVAERLLARERRTIGWFVPTEEP